LAQLWFRCTNWRSSAFTDFVVTAKDSEPW
jgi:hypothetical protein